MNILKAVFLSAWQLIKHWHELYKREQARGDNALRVTLKDGRKLAVYVKRGDYYFYLDDELTYGDVETGILSLDECLEQNIISVQEYIQYYKDDVIAVYNGAIGLTRNQLISMGEIYGMVTG